MDKRDIISYTALFIGVISLSVSTVTCFDLDRYVHDKLDYISEELENEKAEKSREEDYEKRFEELAERIAAIEDEWAEYTAIDEEEIEIEVDTEEEEEETNEEGEWEYDYSDPDEIEFSAYIPVDILQNPTLPMGVETNTYRCMDYRTLTNHASAQWKLQEDCVTDPETGLRTYICDGIPYYCAALGSAYGQTIGDAFKITLNNGYVFNIIYGDFKNTYGSTELFYGHHDTNYDGEDCINIIEFIFDKDAAPDSVLKAGTMSALKQFGGLYGDGGNIVSIQKIGKIW